MGVRRIRVKEKKHILSTKIPEEWIPSIQELMHRHGFTTYDEFLRHLVREALRSEGLLKVIVA